MYNSTSDTTNSSNSLIVGNSLIVVSDKEVGDINIIKKNKLTILNFICNVPMIQNSTIQNSVQSKNSTYTCTKSVHQ